MPSLEISICGLNFQNPILVASGTFGYGVELIDHFPIQRLGGICVKGITYKPRFGNPPPRLVETPCGLINSIGLENVGWERFKEEYLPILKTLGTIIVLNINGETENEYLKLAELASESDGIDVIEVNVSCPNVNRGGIEFGRDPRLLERLVKSIKKVSTKPIWMKLTPNLVDVVEEAKACENGGADAVSLTNTFLATTIDIETFEYKPGFGSGGLSGPAIFPIALYLVREVCRNINIPVIGIGGISNTEIAIQFFLAGASLIQVGTQAMIDPRTPFSIIYGIEEYLMRKGFQSITEIIGLANRIKS